MGWDLMKELDSLIKEPTKRATYAELLVRSLPPIRPSFPPNLTLQNRNTHG